MKSEIDGYRLVNKYVAHIEMDKALGIHRDLEFDSVIVVRPVLIWASLASSNGGFAAGSECFRAFWQMYGQYKWPNILVARPRFWYY